MGGVSYPSQGGVATGTSSSRVINSCIQERREGRKGKEKGGVTKEQKEREKDGKGMKGEGEKAEEEEGFPTGTPSSRVISSCIMPSFICGSFQLFIHLAFQLLTRDYHFNVPVNQLL